MAPFRRAGPDDRMQFVDEENDRPALHDLLEHGLEALLEFAPELGPGNERAEIERNDRAVFQPFGNVAADDAQRQSLDDRGFADARDRRSGRDCFSSGATVSG